MNLNCFKTNLKCINGKMQKDYSMKIMLMMSKLFKH